MSSRFFFAMTFASFVPVMVACGDKPDAEYPNGSGAQGYGAQSPQGGYGAQYQGGTGAGYQGGGATGQGAGGTSPTGGTGAAGGAAPSPQATPIAPAAAAIAAPLLKGLAQQETAGMREDGPAFAGQFQQGQVLEQPFQVQPGRCYTVVGIGVGITELDIELVIGQPGLEYVAAIDQTTGPQAVLGGGQQCFKNLLPIGGPAKVRVKATGGTGVALAQIYSK